MLNSLSSSCAIPSCISVKRSRRGPLSVSEYFDYRLCGSRLTSRIGVLNEQLETLTSRCADLGAPLREAYRSGDSGMDLLENEDVESTGSLSEDGYVHFTDNCGRYVK